MLGINISYIFQMYLKEKEIDESKIMNWLTKNEYQYHLKQIMLKVCSD